MQHDLVDMVIVGCDRVSVTGFVANKIGTYLKALAAKDNEIPFYVGIPSSTIDWMAKDGVTDIPIEIRDGNEVKYVQGLLDGEVRSVQISPSNSACLNYGFDVTPPRLVSGLITERGVIPPTEPAIRQLFGK